MSIGPLYLTTGQTEMTLVHHVRGVILKAPNEIDNIRNISHESKRAKLTTYKTVIPATKR